MKPNDSLKLWYLKEQLKSTATMILTDFEIGKKDFIWKKLIRFFFFFPDGV